MKAHPKGTSATALTVISAFTFLLSSGGCTATRVVSLRYTPLIQTQRLADRTNPPTVVVGQFAFARPEARLAERHPSLSGQPLLSPKGPLSRLEFETADDVPTLVREAFVDGLAKVGFKVSTSNVSAASPLFQLTGKVVAFGVQTSGVLHKTWLTADIQVELTISPQTGAPVTLTVQGQSKREGYEPALENAISDSLDLALQEGVRKFLRSHELLQISGK